MVNADDSFWQDLHGNSQAKPPIRGVHRLVRGKDVNRSEFYGMALKNIGLPAVIQRAASMKFGSGPMKLTSKYLRNPVFARRQSSDLLVFDQIFVEREYSCLDHIGEARSIMDLGANCGFSSAYFLSRYPQARLVSVEPDSGNFAMLTRNTKPYDDRILRLEGAVWSENTRLNFDEDTTGQGVEWGRQTRPAEDVATAGVQAWDVPTLMSMAGFGEVDILKIDIEGAEAAVFSAPDLSWLDRVKNIVIEIHGAECDRVFHEAVAGRDYALSRCGELTVCTGR